VNDNVVSHHRGLKSISVPNVAGANLDFVFPSNIDSIKPTSGAQGVIKDVGSHRMTGSKK
jgi:hypothetical protein